MSEEVLHKALTLALDRAEDMFMGDDGQAWKEYERVREQLHNIAGIDLPVGPDPGYSLHITHDPDLNFEFDASVVLACAHGRYKLGTPDGMDQFVGLLDELMELALQKSGDDTLFTDDFAMQLNPNRPEDQNQILEILGQTLDFEELGVRVKELYLMDHSGLAMSTTPFHCPWDSGQVGFVFTKDANVVTEEMMDSWVNEYSEYLCSGYTQFVVLDRHGDVIEGCTGFTGTDPATNGMKDNISKDIWDYIAEHNNIHVGD